MSAASTLSAPAARRSSGKPASPWGPLLAYQLRDVARSRWTLGYGAALALLTEGLFRFGGTGEAVLLSLANVVLVLAPLVALVFGTSYLYNHRAYVEMMLAQPVPRRTLVLALYAGLALPLALALAAGVLLPFALRLYAPPALAVLVGVGVALTLVFSALALWLSVAVADRVRGLGAALLLWLGTAVLYDALVLLVATFFADYPMEAPLLALTVANPVSLGRVLLLLQFDAAALLGYTGVTYARFFGSVWGALACLVSFALWWGVPLWRAVRRFERADW